MAKHTITVEFDVSEDDVREVYDDLFDGEFPDNIGDAFKSIIETAMYDPDNSDVNMAGEFRVVDVKDN